MYQHLRAEAEAYHQSIWKLQFGAVAAAAAVVSFALGHDTKGIISLDSHSLLLILGGLLFAIGATGAGLTHMYVLYYETTRHIGNVFRNAWLRAERRAAVSEKLSARYGHAYTTYRLNFGHSLRWTFPSVAVSIAGIVLAVCASCKLLP
jgi:hypothetical protein